MSDALPRIDFERVGPAVGTRFPDVRLRNQQGELVDLHDRRAGRRALVVFVRSADW
jgi:peroxiredoxin